jgi:hypothetical protein
MSRFSRRFVTLREGNHGVASTEPLIDDDAVRALVGHPHVVDLGHLGERESARGLEPDGIVSLDPRTTAEQACPRFVDHQALH